jgi:Zn finger protein HypA/HybF involved in hydrogenase expression
VDESRNPAERNEPVAWECRCPHCHKVFTFTLWWACPHCAARFELKGINIVTGATVGEHSAGPSVR